MKIPVIAVRGSDRPAARQEARQTTDGVLPRLMCSAGVLHCIAYLHGTIVSGRLPVAADRFAAFFLPAMQQTSHRSVALWRQVTVPAAGHSARLHCDNAGSAQHRTLLLGKQFFNCRNAFHFNRNSRQTALKSGISRVTFQLILKQQPRPVIMTKMAIGFRKV